MTRAGIIVLAEQALTSAITAQELREVEALDGMASATIIAVLSTTGGDGDATVVVQTGDGIAWYDIARFDFDAQGGAKSVTCSATAGDGLIAVIDALDQEGARQGLLATKLRAVVSTTGTFDVGTRLSVRAAVR